MLLYKEEFSFNVYFLPGYNILEVNVKIVNSSGVEHQGTTNCGNESSKF